VKESSKRVEGNGNLEKQKNRYHYIFFYLSTPLTSQILTEIKKPFSIIWVRE